MDINPSSVPFAYKLYLTLINATLAVNSSAKIVSLAGQLKKKIASVPIAVGHLQKTSPPYSVKHFKKCTTISTSNAATPNVTKLSASWTSRSMKPFASS
jgi:hypothetical protein